MQNDTQPLNDTLVSKSLSAADYVPTLDAMLARTLERIDLKKQQGLRTPDELWIVDHNDVYTLGQAGKEEHILQRTDTPIIKTDRGGQVTWHGHGQLVIYWLFDLDSLKWSVRNLVSHAEQAIEDVINDCLSSSPSNSDNISAHARRDAPGVYLYADTAATDDRTSTDDNSLDNKIMLGKMASLGFKINAINPCGYAGMQMLRLSDFVAMQTDSEQTEPEAQTEQQMSDSFSYETVTQKLIDNIAKRHAGLIELRAIAPK